MKKIKTTFVYIGLMLALFVGSALVSSAFLSITGNTPLIAAYGNVVFLPAMIAVVISLFWRRALKPREIVRIWGISGLAALVIAGVVTALGLGGMTSVIAATLMSLIIMSNLLNRYKKIIDQEG